MCIEDRYQTYFDSSTQRWGVHFEEPQSIRPGGRDPAQNGAIYQTQQDAENAVQTYFMTPPRTPLPCDELLNAITQNRLRANRGVPFSEQDARGWVGQHANAWPIHEMILCLQDQGLLNLMYAQGNGVFVVA